MNNLDLSGIPAPSAARSMVPSSAPEKLLADSVVRRGPRLHNVAVNPETEPAIMEVRAGLGETKAALVGIGATAPQERSVAFDLDDHVLLLAWDEDERLTTVAVGGPRPAETAFWLAEQLEGVGRHVAGVLPPRVRS